MKKQSFLIAALLGSTLLPIASRAQVVTPTAPILAPSMSEADLRALGEGIAFPYEKLDAVLRANVNNEGAVFYSKLRNNNDLETFARAVAIADMTKFPQWMIPPDPEKPNSKATPDRTPQLTFYINAYNGLFLKAIADAYPVNSPSQIEGLDTAKTRVVAGKTYSFAELRELIAEMDPRALFALPDGTNSGPRAAAGVYRYAGLDEQLNAAISFFVNDLTRVGTPARLQNSVEVSPWLATIDGYFAPKTGRRKWNGIRKILSGYTKRKTDQSYFSTGDYQVNFSLENRSINEQLSR
ncbi:MAG TPA: DUF547 domain-containing protein [Abditibacterium sp.]